MILVILGTQKFQLNRLLKELDMLVGNGTLKEEVYAQIGHSSYIPKYYKYTKFLDQEEFENKIKECDLLITHSGVGAIMTGLKYKKKIIVYPRLKQFNEHIDDHQLEIGEIFAEKKFVILCKSDYLLIDAIKESKITVLNEYRAQNKLIVNIIGDYLKKMKRIKNEN